MKITIKFDEKNMEARVLLEEDSKDTVSFYDAMPYCLDALNDFFIAKSKKDMLRGYEYIEDEEDEEDIEQVRKDKVKSIVERIMKGREQ